MVKLGVKARRVRQDGRIRPRDDAAARILNVFDDFPESRESLLALGEVLAVALDGSFRPFDERFREKCFEADVFDETRLVYRRGREVEDADGRRHRHARSREKLDDVLVASERPRDLRRVAAPARAAVMLRAVAAIGDRGIELVRRHRDAELVGARDHSFLDRVG